MSPSTRERAADPVEVTLIEKLAGATVTVESSNRELWARCDTERNAVFGFRDPESFDSHTARQLSEQVEGLLLALGRGRAAALREVGESVGVEVEAEPARRPDAAQRRFHAALAACLPTGVSANGTVVLAANLRLDEFRLRVDAKLLAETDAAGFLRELSGAYRELLRQRRELRAAVTKRHLGG